MFYHLFLYHLTNNEFKFIFAGKLFDIRGFFAGGEGEGNRNQPIDEIAEGGQLMGHGTRKQPMNGNISGGGFPVNVG